MSRNRDYTLRICPLAYCLGKQMELWEGNFAFHYYREITFDKRKQYSRLPTILRRNSFSLILSPVSNIPRVPDKGKREGYA